MYKVALITDLDGTLYNWVDYFAPSFRAMVHTIHKATDINEDDIIDSFQRVYIKHKSIEYPFSIQELDVLSGIPSEKMAQIAKNGRGAFRRTRSKRLKLHQGAKETLQWAKNEEILVIGMTDTEFFQANGRLRSLRIDHLFDSLICRRRFKLPFYALEKESKEYYINTDELYVSQLKPETKTAQSLLKKLKLNRESTYMVGDSLWKDVLFAQNLGIKDIWARYGGVAEEKNLETIRRITTRSAEDTLKNEEAVTTVKPSYIIDSFSEMKSIIGSRQFNLF